MTGASQHNFNVGGPQINFAIEFGPCAQATPPTGQLVRAAQVLHDQAIAIGNRHATDCQHYDPDDLEAARKMFQESTYAGHPCSPLHLAFMAGKRGNWREAEHWYGVRADAGDVSAMHNRGLMLLYDGQRVGARRWLAAARSHGFVCTTDHLAHVDELIRDAVGEPPTD